MNDSYIYQSDSYDRQSQRFVLPLYIKDELGSYNFSSTGTLVKYKGSHYIIFAAHALDGGVDFERVFLFFADGTFHQIKEFAIGHQIFKDDDIVVVDCFNKVLEQKNYFDIEKKSLNGFEKRFFAWTGFPISQSTTKSVHKSKSPEALKEKFVRTDESGNYFKSAKYFTITSKICTNNRLEITGYYCRNNAILKYKGEVSMATHPKGMSGGAIYFFQKNNVLKDDLDLSFRFAGIGIEYKNNKLIIGVARGRIIELLDAFDNENPIQFTLSENCTGAAGEIET